MYFIDVQGTLIDDNKRLPIKGAVEFIDTLNEKKIPYILITNNTKENSGDFIKYLQGLGFGIKEENYIDPFYILKKVLKEKNIKAFGQAGFKNVLSSMGYELDNKKVSGMVVSVDKNYTNEDYSMMIETAFCVDNIVAMHGTSTYKQDGKRYPGVGAVMSMVSFATGKKYDTAGKPSMLFFKKARDKMAQSFDLKDIEFEDITIVSDDFLGDIVGAKKLGMKSHLVLSGKTKSSDEVLHSVDKKYAPDKIFKNIGQIYE